MSSSKGRVSYSKGSVSGLPFPLPKNLKIQPTNNNNQTSADSSSSTTTKKQNYGLNHLQTKWPGETGKGRHLDVIPGMSLFHLLSSPNNKNDSSSAKTIVIPLFQRRYCWPLDQIELWFQDVQRATHSHATHKAMFKRIYTKEQEEQLLCLDGQQRITTTTLLLAAIRPYCRKSNMDTTVKKIDGLLFGSNSEKIHQWAREQAKNIQQNLSQSASEDMETPIEWTLESFPVGWLPQQNTEFRTTLVPSYIDRAAYFEILCFDLIQDALEHLVPEENHPSASPQTIINLVFSDSTKTSAQYKAYSKFSQLTKRLLKPDENADHNAKILSKLFHNQLHKFSMTYLELLTKNDNLQQIFLWMQEKSVFGSGRLLFNPHPGIDFTPVDLARNLIVSSVMDLPLQEQVEAYTRCWIHPLEGRCKDTNVLGDVLLHLVNRIDKEKGKDRHVGAMEEKLIYYKSVVPPALQKNFTDDMPMMIYGRFHSFVQYKATELGSDPNMVSRELADVIVQELVQEGETMGILL